jgi:hypothetical protein
MPRKAAQTIRTAEKLSVLAISFVPPEVLPAYIAIGAVGQKPASKFVWQFIERLVPAQCHKCGIFEKKGG